MFEKSLIGTGRFQWIRSKLWGSTWNVFFQSLLYLSSSTRPGKSLHKNETFIERIYTIVFFSFFERSCIGSKMECSEVSSKILKKFCGLLYFDYNYQLWYKNITRLLVVGIIPSSIFFAVNLALLVKIVQKRSKPLPVEVWFLKKIYSWVRIHWNTVTNLTVHVCFDERLEQ